MKTPDRIKYDSATNAWFAKHPEAVTTVRQCDKCGLYYKSSLRHKCKEDGKDENANRNC